MIRFLFATCVPPPYHEDDPVATFGARHTESCNLYADGAAHRIDIWRRRHHLAGYIRLLELILFPAPLACDCRVVIRLSLSSTRMKWPRKSHLLACDVVASNIKAKVRHGRDGVTTASAEGVRFPIEIRTPPPNGRAGEG
jgi:hypothetical protein